MVLGTISWSWLPFCGLCHCRGGDVDYERWFLRTLIVYPPRQDDLISHLYLQRDFDSCPADCVLYHRQYSHDHHFQGLRLFDWFQHGQREVHLHPVQFPRHIPSLLVARRCLFLLCGGMMRGHSSLPQR